MRFCQREAESATSVHPRMWDVLDVDDDAPDCVEAVLAQRVRSDVERRKVMLCDEIAPIYGNVMKVAANRGGELAYENISQLYLTIEGNLCND